MHVTSALLLISRQNSENYLWFNLSARLQFLKMPIPKMKLRNRFKNINYRCYVV